jgi:hypothetical protein
MGLLPDQDHLTNPFPELEAQRRRTVPGMAYWAGSGPAGTTCRECVFWTGCGQEKGYYASKGMKRGTLKPRKCERYRQMMRGETGPAVPYLTAACKHFERNASPPAIEEPR